MYRLERKSAGEWDPTVINTDMALQYRGHANEVGMKIPDVPVVFM